MNDNFILNYNKVVNELKKQYHPTCCENCIWKPCIIKGKLKRIPILLRRVKEICSKCNILRKSEYRHELCDICAEIYNELEFNYFHKNCSTFSFDRFFL